MYQNRLLQNMPFYKNFLFFKQNTENSTVLFKIAYVHSEFIICKGTLEFYKSSNLPRAK